MTKPRRLTACAILALLSVTTAGCAGPSDHPGAGAKSAGSRGGGAGSSAVRARAVRFSECMRTHGVSAFPDPDVSGALTIDAVANDGGIDTSSTAFAAASNACKALQPPGFTGHGRTERQQAYALKFAQCMREHGIEDFPDPTRDGPLIDTTRIPSAAGRGAREIPGFDEAAHTCGKVYAADAGVRVP